MPEITLDEFDRLAFEAALPDLVERLRAGTFGPVVLVWSEDGSGGHDVDRTGSPTYAAFPRSPTAVRFPREAAPVSLRDAYRAGRLR